MAIPWYTLKQLGLAWLYGMYCMFIILIFKPLGQKAFKFYVFFQVFQEEIAPIQDNVNQVNQLASTFRPPDIQLSPDNLSRIDDLNMRWRLLQVSVHVLSLEVNVNFLLQP